MQLIPVDPSEIPNFRESHRGRVSYPLLKTFLESNMYLAMIDRTGMQQSLQSLSSCLTSYIRSHDLPVKLFTRMGQIYLARLDMDEAGNVDPNWKETRDREKLALEAAEATPITADEVAIRFAEEKDKVAK